MKVNADFCHDTLIENAKLLDSYSTEKDFNVWKEQIKDSFNQIMKVESMNRALNLRLRLFWQLRNLLNIL